MAELGKTVLPVAIPVVAKLATLAATPFQASKRVDEQVRFFIVWFMTLVTLSNQVFVFFQFNF